MKRTVHIILYLFAAILLVIGGFLLTLFKYVHPIDYHEYQSLRLMAAAGFVALVGGIGLLMIARRRA